MAQYKHSQFLKASNSNAFDTLQEPGDPAPFAGIYRCEGCGHEIGIAYGHKLPPQNHHQHRAGLGRIQWRLVVYADHEGS